MKKYILLLFIIIVIIIGTFFIKNYDFINLSQTNNEETSTNTDIDLPNYKLFTIDITAIPNMIPINNIYYDKVISYEQYRSYKEQYPSIAELTESDFENNFMLITAIENGSMSHLVFSKMYKDNDILYIGLKRDTNLNENCNAISIVIPKEMYSDKIEVYKCVDFDIPYDNNYVDIKLLPEDYTLEDAKQDLYCVIEPRVNYNKEVFYSFLDKVDKKENAFIRIVNSLADNGILITDIYYNSKDDKFFVCEDRTRTLWNDTYNYYEYSNIEKQKMLDFTEDFYVLTGEDEEDFLYFLTIY